MNTAYKVTYDGGHVARFSDHDAAMTFARQHDGEVHHRTGLIGQFRDGNATPEFAHLDKDRRKTKEGNHRVAEQQARMGRGRYYGRRIGDDSGADFKRVRTEILPKLERDDLTHALHLHIFGSDRDSQFADDCGYCGERITDPLDGKDNDECQNPKCRAYIGRALLKRIGAYDPDYNDEDKQRDKVPVYSVASQPMEAEPLPSLYIAMEGGMVTAVCSDQPQRYEFARITVIDYDTDDDCETGEVLQGDGSKSTAIIREFSMEECGVTVLDKAETADDPSHGA